MSYFWNAIDMLANQLDRGVTVVIVAVAVGGLLYWAMRSR
jgi:hypothetical protein